MKKRLITAAVGIGLLLLILIWRNTVILNIAISLIGMLAVFELFAASRAVKNRPMLIACLLFAGLTPFLARPYLPVSFETAAVALVLVLFGILLYRHGKSNLSQFGFLLMMTLCVPYALCTLIRLMDLENGLFYFCFAVICAWVTDGGAYFIGSAVGRHRLAPSLSPHKTVEGAVGGVLVNLIFCVIFAFVYSAWVAPGTRVAYFPMLIAALIASLVSMLGDLAASCLKRVYGIKDFGNLLPGHGGVMDRFDSLLAVAPVILIFTHYLTLIR